MAGLTAVMEVLSGSIPSRRMGASSVRRGAGGAAVVLALGMGLTLDPAMAQTAGVVADWSATVTAARKERKVVLYGNPPPPVLARLRTEFEKAYPGIALEYTRIAAAPEVLTRVDQERAGGLDGADVVISTDGATHAWYEERARERYLAAPSGPNAKTWPAKYFARNGLTPLLMLEPIVIAYNTSIIKFPVTGYRDLLRPEFKDHLGTSDIISPSILAWYVWLEKTLGADYVEKLAAQNPRFYGGGIPQAQAAASGEIYAAAFALAASVNALSDSGAPLKVVTPKPSFGIAYTTAIIGPSKRPNAAQVLMDYLLSPQWQEIWAGRGETASPRPGIPGSIDPATVDTSSGVSESPDALARYRIRWISLFHRK